MTLPDDIRHCLRDQIERHGTPHCIQLAPSDSLTDWSDLGVVNLTLDEHFDIRQGLSTLTGPARLALVVDAPTALSRASTQQLLGGLRNYAASAIVAAFSSAAARRRGSWATSDFLGLGFRRLRPACAIESAYWLYRYDIYDYKLTPDWLNSRHWANPGAWDKRRW